MKLLGWMHRKFRQNSSEPLKDFGIGNACNCLTGQPSLDDQQCYPKPSYGNKPFRQQQQAQKDQYLRKSFAGLEAAARAEESELDYDQEDSSSAISELFHGFLAIGTLGNSDTNILNPSTPTFGISVENITEQETEVTENELKLINDELEKVLGAEANKEDGCNDSSGRNSHVSNGRSSHGSTITLSGKPIEGPETNGNGFTVCPLQGYLFGSAIELSETTTAVAKKEHRTSLGELFQRTKLSDQENPGSKCERDQEKRIDKEADKSSLHIMKKILKKKMLHASRSSNATAGGTVDSSSAETKLHKILHMFHRKVHPESSAATKNNGKPMKRENRKSSSHHEAVQDNGGQILVPADEDPQTNLSKEKIRRYKSQSNPPQFTISGSDSNGNREFWIKTDADYLVLEL
ncbi:hypothetical protein AB3S75_038249 [Citrus x aurantiifolia]